MSRALSALLGGALGLAVVGLVSLGCGCPPLTSHPLITTGTHVLDTSDYGMQFNDDIAPDYQLEVDAERTRVVETYTVEGQAHRVEYDVVNMGGTDYGDRPRRLPPEE